MAISIAAAIQAGAEVFANYGFEGGAVISSDASTATSAGAYTGTYYNADGAEVHGPLDVGFGAIGWVFRSDVENSSDGLAPNTFTQQFTITVPEGAIVKFDTFSFDFGGRENLGAASPNTINFAFSLRSTLTGGNFVNGGSLGTNLGNDSFSVLGGSPAGVYNPDDDPGSGATVPSNALKSYSISLSDPAFDNVAGGVGGTVVTFALALSSDRENTMRNLLIDNVILSGTVIQSPPPPPTDRVDEVLNAYIDNPQSNPNGTSDETKVWGRASWSLAALTQNRSAAEIDLANTYIQSIPTLAPIPAGDPDNFGFNAFFSMPVIVRCYMAFKDSPLLTQTSKDALEGYMWDFVSRRHVNTGIEPGQRSAWYQFNSENKDTVEKHAMLLACEGLIESPNYGPNTTLADGKTLAEYRDFLQAYYVEYFRQRAREGMTYEVGSPAYLRLTLSTYYNLHDFSRSSVLRKVASDYLTLYWALKVQEYLPDSRMWGGGIIRHEKDYVESASSESYSPVPYIYGWNDVFSRSHPMMLIMATSSYSPPAIVSAIASDANRPLAANQLLGTTGSGYLLTSRIWGRGTNGSENSKNAIFEPDNSANTRRDTWVHANYNIGGFTFDLSESGSKYIEGNKQNRSMGIYFNSDRSARIIFHCEGAANNKSYMGINGVVGANVLVGARANTVYNSGDDTFVFISKGTLRDNMVVDGGWIFTRTADTYVGIYIANGSYNEVQSQLGNPMVELTNEWSPVVFQLGGANEYGIDFEAFKASVKANAATYSGGKLTYVSEDGETFEMWANSSNVPRVNGVPVDLNPAKTYESPFLNAYHGLNTMTVSYPGYPDLTLDFANYEFPQWDDYQTVALWNMDALNGSAGIADDNGGNVARETNDQRPARNLTLTGATLTTSAGGRFGEALSFDGIDDRAVASGAWSSAFRTVKLEGWIYPTNGDGANVIVAADGVWKLELNNHSLNFVSWNDSVTPTPLEWPVPLTLNTWHHFVASVDNAGTMQLSANGEPPVVAVVSNLRSLNAQIDLGDRPGSNRYFQGLMDDIKVSHLYTKALLPRDPMSSLGAFRHQYGLAADGTDDLLVNTNSGVANIFHFLFGLGDPGAAAVPVLDPENGTMRGLPTHELSGEGEFTYSYVNRLNQTGPRVRVLSSENLESWGDVDDEFSAHRPSRITTTPVDANYEIRHLHFSPLADRLFLHFDLDSTE